MPWPLLLNASAHPSAGGGEGAAGAVVCHAFAIPSPESVPPPTHHPSPAHAQTKALVEMENTGLLALLRLDKYEDMRRMYLLFRRVDGGLALVRQMMADHVKDSGRQLVTVGGCGGLEGADGAGHG